MIHFVRCCIVTVDDKVSVNRRMENSCTFSLSLGIILSIHIFHHICINDSIQMQSRVKSSIHSKLLLNYTIHQLLAFSSFDKTKKTKEIQSFYSSVQLNIKKNSIYQLIDWFPFSFHFVYFFSIRFICSNLTMQCKKR